MVKPFVKNSKSLCLRKWVAVRRKWFIGKDMGNSRKRVALLVETSLGSGREILRGIARHAQQSDEWQLFHAARGLEEKVPEWLRKWSGDGVIARIQDAAMVRQLKKLNLPVVDVLGVAESADFPLVHVDDRRIGSEVARYFLDRGYRHFGFYGIVGENWSVQRGDAFRARCEQAETTQSVGILQADRGAAGDVNRWLRELPKPVAIMVSSDQRGLELLEACREENLQVPERVAVVSVDNDVPLCEISSPPLTSVRAGHQRVGFEAARLLERLMNGESAADQALLVPPTGIVTRQSSEGQAIDDEVVAGGLHFLHGHIGEAINNQSIAAAAGVSRTVFQRRFREAMGTSVRDYLTRHRLKRAQDLIKNSEMTFADIAERCGFKHQEYLGYVVQKHFGTTPGKMRALADD